VSTNCVQYTERVFQYCKAAAELYNMYKDPPLYNITKQLHNMYKYPVTKANYTRVFDPFLRVHPKTLTGEGSRKYI